MHHTKLKDMENTIERILDSGIQVVSEFQLTPETLATCTSLSGCFDTNPAASRVMHEITSTFGISLDTARISTFQRSNWVVNKSGNWQYLGVAVDEYGDYNWERNAAKIHFAYFVGESAPWEWVEGTWSLAKNWRALDAQIKGHAQPTWVKRPWSGTLYAFTDLEPIRWIESAPHWRFLATIFPQ